MDRKTKFLLILAAILLVAINLLACDLHPECGYSDIPGLCATMAAIETASAEGRAQ